MKTLNIKKFPKKDTPKKKENTKQRLIWITILMSRAYSAQKIFWVFCYFFFLFVKVQSNWLFFYNYEKTLFKNIWKLEEGLNEGDTQIGRREAQPPHNPFGYWPVVYTVERNSSI